MRKVVLLLLFCALGILIRYLSIPAFIRSEMVSGFFSRPYYSYTTYSGDPIDPSTVHEARVFRGFFSFENRLDSVASMHLMTVLTDSMNYVAEIDDFVLSDADKIFLYYNRDGLELGYTFFKDDGAAITLPTLLNGTGNGHLRHSATAEVQRLAE